MIVPLDSFLITFNVPALMLYAPEPARFLMARTTHLICWGCSFSLSNSLSMRSRSISSVAGGLEYTWFLMWPHKKMSHGVRSGLLGSHSWQNPRPKNPISKHFMKLVSYIETSVGWCTVLHEPNVPSHISICFWNWWQNSIIKHVSVLDSSQRSLIEKRPYDTPIATNSCPQRKLFSSNAFFKDKSFWSILWPEACILGIDSTIHCKCCLVSHYQFVTNISYRCKSQLQKVILLR